MKIKMSDVYYITSISKFCEDIEKDKNLHRKFLYLTEFCFDNLDIKISYDSIFNFSLDFSFEGDIYGDKIKNFCSKIKEIYIEEDDKHGGHGNLIYNICNSRFIKLCNNLKSLTIESFRVIPSLVTLTKRCRRIIVDNICYSDDIRYIENISDIKLKHIKYVDLNDSYKIMSNVTKSKLKSIFPNAKIKLIYNNCDKSDDEFI